MVVSKFMLLGGKDYRKTIQINEEGAEVIIRPLTNFEIGEINEIRMKGFRVNTMGEVVGEVDASLFSKNEFQAQNYTIVKGLVEPALSLEEVKELPQDIYTKLVKEIIEITGQGKAVEDAVDSFREIK